jgi:hypothetical protein
MNPELSRLEPIKYLSDTYQVAVDCETLAHQEQEAKRKHDAYGILPTIGSEVEVKLSAVNPDVMHEFFGQPDAYGRYAHTYDDLPTEQKTAFDIVCKAFERQRLPAYHAAWQAGIPKGKDAFWEFANSPAYDWRTLAAEIELLFSSGLVPADVEHSLHVTLGGVDPQGGGMCLVLSGLELLFVTPERIAGATDYHYTDKRSGWARRGEDGLRKRSGLELRLGKSVATEFRTLTVTTPETASTILQTAQMLSSILLAFRHRHEAKQPTVQSIASLWPLYRQELKNLWTHRNLPAESWGPPHDHPAPWLGWAACLQRRKDSTSPEADLVGFIKELTSFSQQLIDTL